MSKLQAYRSAHGLSQADFAKSVGVKKATISRIEKGRRTPSMGLVSRMVEASSGALSADDFLPSPPSAPSTEPQPERDDDHDGHADDRAAADGVDAHAESSS